MRSAPRSLDQIRSDACNVILLTITILAIPAAGASLLRGTEQGWRPVMGLHIALLAVLIGAAFLRHRLSLTFRAIVVTAVPFVISIGGLLTYGRGNGVTMFFISSCVVAGCFFSRRVALSIVALGVATLAAIYISYSFGLVALPADPGSSDMSAISWLTLGVGLLAAGSAPVIGVSALLQSLEAERVRADEAAKVRSEFLANISHELRTPMTGILGMAEALKTTPLNGQQQTVIANLMLSGGNLLAVLNNLLDFTKFETGHVPVEALPFHLSELIRNTCAVFETKAAQKGIELSLDLSPHLHDAVIGDSFRIGQVLSNLIDNAIKFTARGAVVLRIEQTAREDGSLLLTCAVTDTGIGIAADQIERIFDPFVQGDMTTSRAYGGSGLGLTICRDLVNAMGGDIHVSSDIDEGSVFTMSIPLGRQNTVPRPAAVQTFMASTLHMPEQSEPAGLRVLLADDDMNMRILANIMLPPRGHDVTIVEDGGAALAAASANAYDCIIMDMHMPVMNGPTVMRAIKKTEARRTPMIALTADVIPEHIHAFMDAGADAVIAKPVQWDKLEAKMQELTRTRVSANVIF